MSKKGLKVFVWIAIVALLIILSFYIGYKLGQNSSVRLSPPRSTAVQSETGWIWSDPCEKQPDGCHGQYYCEGGETKFKCEGGAGDRCVQSTNPDCRRVQTETIKVTIAAPVILYLPLASNLIVV